MRYPGVDKSVASMELASGINGFALQDFDARQPDISRAAPVTGFRYPR